MRQESMNVLFAIKKSSVMKNGEVPIIIRITINGVHDEARIQRSLPVNLWNQAKGCSKGKDRNSLEINNFIDALKTKAHHLHKELLLEEAHITPSYLLQCLFNKGEKLTMLKTMKSHIEDMEKLVDIDYEKVTLNRYWNCYRSVEKCVLEFYQKEDIVFPELSKQFIQHLDRHLRLEKRLCQNTIVRYIKCFKKFVNMALDEGWMKRNPFAGMKYTQEESVTTFLTLDEVRRIASKNFPHERLNLVRDMFLFSCMTGLAFVDAKELRREDIYKDNNDKLWIRKARHKIKKNKARCTSTIPLLEPAVKILSFYENHPKCEESGLCLPLYCNQTMNVCLKEIAAVCNISKNLTTHVARHTFATTIALANKVSLQNVSKMMGHTTTRMTEHYARVMDQTIMDDMEKIELSFVM